jgi:hypothetical protein
VSDRRWIPRLNALPSSPAYATATTVLAVVAGLLGSVYQDDVAHAFPLVLRGPWGPLSLKAVVFWASVVVFAVMFFFRQLSDDESRLRLADTADRVETLVRTMPPRAFQSQLAKMIGTSHSSMAQLLPRDKRSDLRREDLAGLTRALLNSIARLALIYDNEPVGAAYSANVMIFVPLDGGRLPDEVAAALRFYPKDYDLSRLAGALVLRTELSATSDTTDIPGPDTSVMAIALPIPSETTHGGRWNTLPGAPKAFVTQEVDGYDDSGTLGEWCEKSGDFPPSVTDELRHYFTTGAGRVIRSFISRPLVFGGTVSGVLNLHSNRKDILGDTDERMPAFLAMMAPLFLQLESTLEILRNYDQPPPGGPVVTG